MHDREQTSGAMTRKLGMSGEVSNGISNLESFSLERLNCSITIVTPLMLSPERAALGTKIAAIRPTRTSVIVELVGNAVWPSTTSDLLSGSDAGVFSSPFSSPLVS